MKHEQNIQKTIDFYNKNAEDYSNKIESKIQYEQIEKFSNLLNNQGRILDVGCAAGRDSRELKSRGFEIVGIDLSEELLNIAKKKDPDSIYIMMDMRELDFPKHSFDGVFASASLLHLPSKEDVIKTVKEFHRVLVNGGVLYISVKEQLGDQKTEIVGEELSDGNLRFFQYFKKEELLGILEQNEFEILDITENDSNREIKVSWIRLIAKKLP